MTTLPVERFVDLPDADREAGWTTLFRGNDAILRVRDEHVQSTQVLDEAAGSGKPPWTRVPR
jgi:hypothetical protein